MTTPDPERWLDQHGDALYAFAMLRLHNAANAEDMVQETLLAALGAAERFDGGSSERTWLVGIMKHKIYDLLRKHGREQALDDGNDADDWAGKFDSTGHWATAPSAWGDPARLTENAALAAAMQACIGHLPERLRAAFVMREIDGAETSEVIELLGISSANNLWVMLSRAREKLRECIDRNWYAGATQ